MLRRWLPAALLILTAAPSAAPPVAHATEVWSGRTYGFTKAPFGDVNLPANQDRISPLVWITRGGSLGIYNIHDEAGYTHNVSPAGTEWATGDAIYHASLTFAPWEIWAQANPPATLGVPAVVHLIAEDIYVDISFDLWGAGASGGTFAYRRGLPPAVPTRPTSWGKIKSLYR